MQVAVVGDSKCIHPMLNSFLYQSRDRTGPVEQAVMGMAVKMGKFPVRHDVPFQFPGCRFYYCGVMFAMRQNQRTRSKNRGENVRELGSLTQSSKVATVFECTNWVGSCYPAQFHVHGNFG